MNPWDIVTWISSVILAGTALVIFGFFLRDARSILNREMHGHDEDSDDSSAPAVTPETPPSPPRDRPQ